MKRQNSEQKSIETLFAAIAVDGDEKAFERLFLQFYVKLVGFCNEYVKSRESAEDIVSELFVKLWINRDALKGVKKPEVYIFTAAKNASLNHVTKLSTVRVHQNNTAELFDEKFSFLETPQDQLEEKEIFRLLNEAIEGLPPQSRIIVRLMKEDGFKAKEVAEILQISIRTVENQLYRALLRLDKALSPYFERRAKPKPPLDKMLSLFFLA